MTSWHKWSINKYIKWEVINCKCVENGTAEMCYWHRHPIAWPLSDKAYRHRKIVFELQMLKNGTEMCSWPVHPSLFGAGI